MYHGTGARQQPVRANHFNWSLHTNRNSRHMLPRQEKCRIVDFVCPPLQPVPVFKALAKIMNSLTNRTYRLFQNRGHHHLPITRKDGQCTGKESYRKTTKLISILNIPGVDWKIILKVQQREASEQFCGERLNKLHL